MAWLLASHLSILPFSANWRRSLRPDGGFAAQVQVTLFVCGLALLSTLLPYDPSPLDYLKIARSSWLVAANPILTRFRS